jgi:glycosyltransferase involved in cell wall biosynthesis
MWLGEHATQVYYPPMRVVHLGKYYPPHRGGIESVTETLCRGLASRGVDVTVLVSNDTRGSESELVDGVRILRIGRQAEFRSQPLNLGLARALRSLDYDVLHVHTPNPIGALTALGAPRGKPIVVTHHSDIFRQRILGVAGTLAHGLLYQRSRAVVAATPRHLEFSSLLRRFRDRCRVIPFALANPIPNTGTSWDEALPDAWRAAPLALFVGRLVYYKGVDVLLEALQLTPNVNLAIVGTGPLQQNLVRQSQRLGLEQRVVFVGNVDEARLHALYRACRYLVLPSTSAAEAFGMVQLEAMSVGKPVISTRLPSGVPFVNQHERTGLTVSPGSSSALASAMNRLGSHDALAASLGAAAKLRASSDFGAERVLDQWLALYGELAPGS